MTATAADLARYTVDGVVLTTDPVAGAAIKAVHPDARDLGDAEIESFFDYAADAQIMLNERFGYLSRVGPPHEMIEVADDIGFGVTIALTPVVPSFYLVDESQSIAGNARVRAYGYATATDRYSFEVLG